MILVDAHSHLWLTQKAVVDGQNITQMPNGRAMFFGEERQMLPPFMIDGRNSAEVFVSNMDYAQVSAAVVVQEIIDGNQNSYLLEVQKKFPKRFFCCGMPDFNISPAGQAGVLADMGFKGVALPAHRLNTALDSPEWMEFFIEAESRGLVASVCLADSLEQIRQMENVISRCPRLKIAIGHFGMAKGKYWLDQIKLSLAEMVYIEAGGITWLYNSEFYPFPSAIRAIRVAADTVGMDKLMWGSDYPRTITAITYRMSYDFVQKSAVFDESEKKMFLGENAMRFYGLTDLTELPYIKNMSE